MSDTYSVKQLRIDAKEWINNNGVSQKVLGELIGLSESWISDFMTGRRSLRADTILKLDRIIGTTKRNKSMKPQAQNTDSEGLEQINAGVIARYAQSKHSTIREFQTALTDGSGFVPGQSGTETPDSIVDLLKTVAVGNDADVTRKLRDLINGLQRQSSDTIRKATPNAGGSTRSPLVVKSTDGGARAKVIDAQAFGTNEQGGNVLNLQAGNALVAACKRDTLKAQAAKSLKTHEDKTVELQVRKGSMLNLSKGGYKLAADMHSESTIRATDAEYKTNLRLNAEAKAQLARAKAGAATLDDLRSKMNSFKA